MKSFHLSIVSPDRSVAEEPVLSLIVPGIDGYFGMLADHAPIVAGLKAGLIEYEQEHGQRHYVAVAGGFLEMDGKKATVLADAAERATEIDLAKAEHKLEEARKCLRGENGEMPTEQAVFELDYAIYRVKAAKMG